MKKKILTVLCFSMCILSLVGCGKKDKEEDEEDYEAPNYQVGSNYNTNKTETTGVTEEELDKDDIEYVEEEDPEDDMYVGENGCYGYYDKDKKSILIFNPNNSTVGFHNKTKNIELTGTFDIDTMTFSDSSGTFKVSYYISDEDDSLCFDLYDKGYRMNRNSIKQLKEKDLPLYNSINGIESLKDPADKIEYSEELNIPAGKHLPDFFSDFEGRWDYENGDCWLEVYPAEEDSMVNIKFHCDNYVTNDKYWDIVKKCPFVVTNNTMLCIQDEEYKLYLYLRHNDEDLNLQINSVGNHYSQTTINLVKPE